MSVKYEKMDPRMMVNKYSKVSQHCGGRITVGPQSGRPSNYMIVFAFIALGIAFLQVFAYLLPKGYIFTTLVS
jgi:hypothetical protein